MDHLLFFLNKRYEMFGTRLTHKHTKVSFLLGKKAQSPLKAIVSDINLMCQLDRLSGLLKKKWRALNTNLKPVMSHDINITNKPACSRLVAGLAVAHM